MTLPTSGTINCSQIDVELGDSGTSIISLGDADARALAGVPSGAISMSDFYGKSSVLPNPPYWSTLTAGFNNGASSFNNAWGWSSNSSLWGAVFGSCSPATIKYSGGSFATYAFVWSQSKIYVSALSSGYRSGTLNILNNSTNALIASVSLGGWQNGAAGTIIGQATLASNPFVVGQSYKVYMP